jgi:cytochrome P450
MIPPKPVPRPDRVSLWRYWRMFRRDVLSAQPMRLYTAKMAEFRTPFFRSFMVNEPDLVRRILVEKAEHYPKSERMTGGLKPLLGQSVFVTNGETWARQRRIIDPAFAGGRIRDAFPGMLEAAQAATARIHEGRLDVEAWASHATADVIFRSLFSVPIEDATALETYQAFRAFQRAQPVATLSALIPWWPTGQGREARRAASRLRLLLKQFVDQRADDIAKRNAPDDLATKIMTTSDPETGRGFSPEEMVDQVAIFFLAGHETSAALMGWTLWCLAADGHWMARVDQEAASFMAAPEYSSLSSMRHTKNVLREVARLYPPVPMVVREAIVPDEIRGRRVPIGAQVVVSPWHLQRNERYWEDPDAFDPGRWDREPPKEAWLPFGMGPRVCPGAGFAMAEAAVLLAAVLARWRFEVQETPVPVAHLTVRSRDGIFLKAKRR